MSFLVGFIIGALVIAVAAVVIFYQIGKGVHLPW